jgi:hypothetical protein
VELPFGSEGHTFIKLLGNFTREMFGSRPLQFLCARLRRAPGECGELNWRLTSPIQLPCTLRAPRKSRSWAFLMLACLPYAFVAATPARAKTSGPTTVSYGRDVAPIFKAHCVSCHSGASPAGKLDLSSKAGILLGGASGKLFSGEVKGALLLQRIDGSVAPQMPMGMPPLSLDEQAKIKGWLQGGMTFDAAGPLKHWAYVAPVAVAVPQLGSSWVRNPVDAFILQKLRQSSLHPSVEASKETLIRRVSLDLIGLPPTPEEVKDFLADKSSGAYDRVVDRLLASPHYGERQAREWLDLARYADSDGYEKDLGRSAWLYRDWVIDAFNKNLPYDTFTIKQIAGDLVPNASIQDKVATGFQRNTMQNLEGGVDQEEAHFLVVMDRAETTSAVWLGSTLNCARCHDHKYDPFTQKDYYKMVAFYNNTKVYPRGPRDVGEEKWFESELQVPRPDIEVKTSKLQTQIAEIQRRMASEKSKDQQQFDSWKLFAANPATWDVLPLSSATSLNGAKLIPQEDGSIVATGPAPDTDSYTILAKPLTKKVKGLRLQALPDSIFASQGPGRSDNGNFVLRRIRVWQGEKEVPLSYAAADYAQEQYPAMDSITGEGGGWAVNGSLGKPHELAIQLDDPVPPGAVLRIDLDMNSPFARHTLGKFRLSTTSEGDPSTWVMPVELRKALADPARTTESESKLRSYFEENSPPYGLENYEISRSQAEIEKLKQGWPTALVMEEKPTDKPLSEWVRHRGEFGSKTEQVLAGTPSILPPLAPGKADRLALARWLVSKNNPLTARVQVNRMWEQLFGRGIVETSEDFGTRGSRPSHPELLDWLACWFMNHNWDMKALNRLLVTSATYRQSSAATPALLAKDPENRLLARGARFRMEAEMIHDVSLADGGILSTKMGGPSVYPYQPDGIWDSPYSGQTWMSSKGEDAYRRAVYTFWKRTAPYPSFIAMDAGSREVCTVRRIRTNTPLQALALLNDKLMLQAAEALGKRMEASGADREKRLSEGFFICTSRTPAPSELARLDKLERKLESRYVAMPERAKMLGGAPQDAAYTLVANVLLNLDETITKS